MFDFIFDFMPARLRTHCTVAALEIRWSDEQITGSSWAISDGREADLEIQIERNYFKKLGPTSIRTLHISWRFGKFMSCAVATSVGGMAH